MLILSPQGWIFIFDFDLRNSRGWIAAVCVVCVVCLVCVVCCNELQEEEEEEGSDGDSDGDDNEEEEEDEEERVVGTIVERDIDFFLSSMFFRS